MLDDPSRDRKIASIGCLKGRVSTHVDIQSQVRNSKDKAKKCTCSNC